MHMHTLPANDGVRIHTQLPPVLVLDLSPSVM